MSTCGLFTFRACTEGKLTMNIKLNRPLARVDKKVNLAFRELNGRKSDLGSLSKSDDGQRFG